MRSKLIILPVLLAAICVGFIVFYGRSSAEQVAVQSAAVEGYGAGADQYNGAAASQYQVPADIYYTRPVESVVFSHQTHAVEGHMSCSTCHTSKFQMKALSVQEQPDFTMQGLAEGKYCGSCHNGNGTFSSSTQCARCHTGVRGLEGGEAQPSD